MFLARALAQEGRIILLDEPFTGVDVKTEAAIIGLLRELRAAGHLMLVSTHNLGSVPEFCDQVVLINRTVLAAGPTATVFTQANLERAFGGVLRHFQLGGRALHDDDDRAQRHGADRRRAAAGVLRRRADGLTQHRAASDDGQAVIAELLVPFGYDYMLKAMWVSALVGGVCAFLSAYLMLKGWSLMGDALAHSIVPGVAGAYMLGAALRGRRLLRRHPAAARHAVRQAAARGCARTRSSASSSPSFFALGLLMVSI